MKRLAIVCGALVLAACAAPIRAPVAERSVLDRVDAARYEVQRGDSLYSIAYRRSLDYRDLVAWNDITEPFTIFPGQTLRLVAPSPSSPSNAAPRARPPTPRTPRISRPSPAVSAGRWQWPVDVQPTRRFDHAGTGLDYDLPAGTTIRAASPGEVVFVGPGIGNFLHLVIVKVDERYLAAYGVNVPPLVAEGDGVGAGSSIARVGGGRASLRQFHFEIRERGKPVDPHRLIR